MKKGLESLRKEPKQGRSRDLVESIFQATVRILPKLGPENLTTKKIAEVAGISVGSLYQYFPNKVSVLGAVMDASAGLINSTLSSRFSKIPEMQLDDAVQFAVDSGIEIFLSEREQIREIFRQVNELGRTETILRFRQTTVVFLGGELHRRYPQISARECERIGFVTVNSLMGVTLTMLYDDTQSWTQEELARELGDMFKVYVRHKIAMSGARPGDGV